MIIFSIYRPPPFGQLVWEALKFIYASLYCDLYRFFDVPDLVVNLPLIGDLQTADVITTETLFERIAGLVSLLSDQISIEDIVGISDGDRDQSSEESPP